MKPAPVTAARIERCLDRVALAIAAAGTDGTAYLPLFERLERELTALRCRESSLEAALARAAQHSGHRLAG